MLSLVVELHAKVSKLSRSDRERLGRMLLAIGGVFGSDPFLVRGLFERAAAAIRLVLADLNAKQVGRLFRRARGQPVEGYLVQHDGAELHVNLWRVLGAAAGQKAASMPD